MREEEAARAEKKGRKKNLTLLSFAEDEDGGDGGGAADARRGIASAHDLLEDARRAWHLHCMLMGFFGFRSNITYNPRTTCWRAPGALGTCIACSWILFWGWV